MTTGKNTIIMEPCTIEENVSIGNNCVIYPHSHIKQGTRIQDNVVIGKPAKSTAASTFQVEEKEGATIGENSLICTNAIIYGNTKLGPGCIIADSAIIREDSTLGERVKVGKLAIIEFNCIIGDRVSLQAHSLIAEKSNIGNDVFIGPNVSMALDLYMARKGNPLNPITIESGAAIGASSTLLPGVRIGKNAIIAAGSIVNKPLEGGYVYIGNPLRKFREVEDDEILLNK